MNVESLSSSSNVNVTCTPPTTHCRPKRTKRSPDENDSQEPTPKRQRSMSKKNITDCRDPLFSFVSDAGNDGCGLKNLGNSCFINAFVQCFANEDILVTRLLDYTQAHVKDDRTMAQFTTRNYSQDARQYDFMFKWISSFAQAVSIVNKNDSIVLNLSDLKSKSPYPFNQFNRQQDAAGFGISLLRAIGCFFPELDSELVLEVTQTT
eukprot:450820_1